MTKPRSHYVYCRRARYYHVTSRCVRRAWLLGRDPLTGANHDHRKAVLIQRMHHLARYFAVKVMGYAIMSNHFHLVLHYDPLEASQWSEEEVALRWCAVFHGKSIAAATDGAPTLEDLDLKRQIRYHGLLLDPDRLNRCRDALGSLSRYMQHLKQPFSLWANREDGCKGSFYEKRFYSGVLRTEDDLLACMAYVDLNPVEAGMAKTLREADNTSIGERLEQQAFDSNALEAYLAPLGEQSAILDRADSRAETAKDKRSTASSTSSKTLTCTLKTYAEQLSIAIACMTDPNADVPHGVTTWMARLLNRKRKPRRHVAAFYDYA